MSDKYSETMNEGQLDLEDTAKLLWEHIKQLSKKIRNGRISDIANEELRLKQIRALSTLCKTYANIVKDTKVEDLERRLEILEK